MTPRELLQYFTEISETNPFPAQYGDGAVLTGMTLNDIYQLGYAAAFQQCHLAVREFVNGQAAPDERTMRCGRCGEWRPIADVEVEDRGSYSIAICRECKEGK